MLKDYTIATVPAGTIENGEFRKNSTYDINTQVCAGIAEIGTKARDENGR